MKKGLAWFIGILILFFAALYIFIPGKIAITNSVLLKANPQGVNRCLLNAQNWNKLTGAGSSSGNTSFSYNNYHFEIDQLLFNGIHLHIQDEKPFADCVITFFPSGIDSSGLIWQTEVETSTNPFTRLQQYFQTNQLKNTVTDLIEKIQTFCSTESNVYGLDIQMKTVTDTMLIATKLNFKTYPSDSAIYGMIQTLKNYIAARNLKETNYPMLNMIDPQDTIFNTMVAIPVNEEIANEGNIMYKRMVSGKILVAEVKGGLSAVNKAYETVNDYAQDHQFSQPAIPFQSLITDRIKETDTSKWITKIYYPIY